MVGACVGGGGLSLLPYLPLLKKNDFQHMKYKTGISCFSEIFNVKHLEGVCCCVHVSVRHDLTAGSSHY